METHLTINLGNLTTSPIKLIKGFADGENTHRWTNGTEASMSIPVFHDKKRISHIAFDTRGLVSATVSQTLTVSGPFLETKEYEYTQEQSTHRVVLEIPDTITSEICLHFSMPNACRPLKVDPSNQDPRLLAIAFTTADILLRVVLPSPPSHFHSVKALREIARNPRWRRQGTNSFGLGKLPGGVGDINTNKPSTLEDINEIIKKRGQNSRSQMTTDFYELVPKLTNDRKADFLKLMEFCQKWNFNVLNMQERTPLHDALIDDIQNLIYILNFETGPRHNGNGKIHISEGPKNIEAMHAVLKAAIEAVKNLDPTILSDTLEKYAHQYDVVWTYIRGQVSLSNGGYASIAKKLGTVKDQPGYLIDQVVSRVRTALDP